MQLFGGARKDFSKTGRGRFRQDINILLCGDPGNIRGLWITLSLLLSKFIDIIISRFSAIWSVLSTDCGSHCLIISTTLWLTHFKVPASLRCSNMCTTWCPEVSTPVVRAAPLLGSLLTSQGILRLDKSCFKLVSYSLTKRVVINLFKRVQICSGSGHNHMDYGGGAV